jgi:hypothetical protein
MAAPQLLRELEAKLRLQSELMKERRGNQLAAQNGAGLRHQELENKVLGLLHAEAAAQENAARAKQEANVRWATVMDAVAALENRLDTHERNVAASAGYGDTVWERLADAMKRDKEERLQEDGRRTNTINEAIAFLRDGKDTWARMIDFKIAETLENLRSSVVQPAAPTAQVWREQPVAAQLNEKVERLEMLLTHTSSKVESLQSECHQLREALTQESKIREVSEANLSNLLELAVLRLDDLRS